MPGARPESRRAFMSITTSQLQAKKCKPCEGGVPALSAEQVRENLRAVPAWELVDGLRLRRSWKVKDFATGLDFFRRIGDVAEAEDHHPDLHLTGYRHVTVELWTHAVGGLTE